MKNFEDHVEKAVDVAGRSIKFGDYLYELVGSRPFFHRVVKINRYEIKFISVMRDGGFWALYLDGKPHNHYNPTENMLIINESIIPTFPYQLLLAANASMKSE